MRLSTRTLYSLKTLDKITLSECYSYLGLLSLSREYYGTSVLEANQRLSLQANSKIDNLFRTTLQLRFGAFGRR